MELCLTTWEDNTLVFGHTWSLFTGSVMQNMSIVETKSMVAVDRDSFLSLTHRIVGLVLRLTRICQDNSEPEVLVT